MNQKLILQAPLLNILLVPLGSDGGVVGSCLGTSAMVVIHQNRENRKKKAYLRNNQRQIFSCFGAPGGARNFLGILFRGKSTQGT